MPITPTAHQDRYIMSTKQADLLKKLYEHAAGIKKASKKLRAVFTESPGAYNEVNRLVVAETIDTTLASLYDLDATLEDTN